MKSRLKAIPNKHTLLAWNALFRHETLGNIENKANGELLTFISYLPTIIVKFYVGLRIQGKFDEFNDPLDLTFFSLMLH